jgi:thioredoxin 1
METRVIDESTEKTLREIFAQRLAAPVDLILYTGQENEDATEFTRRFLRELSDLSDKLTLEERSLDGDARQRGLVSPSIEIGRKRGYRVEMLGAPSGHEAGAFIETLAMVSSGDSGLSQDSRRKLARLDKEILLYSFVTPSCPHCPGAVLQNHRIAVAAPGKVRSVAVSAAENMELSRRFQVQSVPQQVINEDPASISVGVQPESRYVDQILGYSVSDPEAVLAEFRAAAAEREQLVDAPNHPVTLTDASFDQAVQKYPLLVVDFWAEWCGPCRVIGPIIEQLAGEQRGRIAFGKLDTEANPETPARFDIHSIPTMLVFKNGQLADRLVGVQPKDALLAEFEKHMD